MSQSSSSYPSSESPESGVADAVTALTEDTRVLVRREIEASQREVLDKIKQAAPGIALIVAAALCGAFATASAYRLVMRLLDRAFSPAAAPAIATALFGAAGAGAATAGIARLRSAPAPLPTRVAQESARATAEAARS
jgi:hypothetical protein